MTNYEVKHVVVSPEYVQCEDEVERIGYSIRRLIDSVKNMFDEVVTKDNVNQLVPEYMNCLMRNIRIAVEDVHKIIQKHHVTDEKEIEMLESKITEMFDEVTDGF